jgi:hypothetical protein
MEYRSSVTSWLDAILVLDSTIASAQGEENAIAATLAAYDARPFGDIATFPAAEIAQALRRTLEATDICRTFMAGTEAYRRSMTEHIIMQNLIAAKPLLSPMQLARGNEKNARRFQQLYETSTEWFFAMLRIWPAWTNLTQPVQSWIARVYVHYRFGTRKSGERLHWFRRQLRDSLPDAIASHNEWPPFAADAVGTPLPDLPLQPWKDTGLDAHFTTTAPL